MPKRTAFTLVELLVVIGIIALLVSVLLPAIGKARSQAAAVKCQTQLREIGSCFKMYEIDHKGYWPVARTNGLVAGKPYSLDGFNYIGTSQAYWFSFLAKYATKSKMGAEAAATGNAQAGLLSRQTIFFGCPAFEGYRNGGATTLVGDTNVVQTGYGMNPYPSFAPGKSFPSIPPPSENAVISASDNIIGRFPRARDYSKASERMLVADAKFWLASSGQPPVRTTYPPAVVAQPEFANSNSGMGSDPAQSLVDMYRHGKYPSRSPTGTLDPYGGRINYNILYADGHVGQATDGREAYRSIRMRFPG